MKAKKDFIAISEHICEVCGVKHTHNTEVLIHKRLRDIPEDKRVTGYGLCKEHERLFEEGYIALVGALEPAGNTRVKLEDAHRTGAVIHMKRDVFKATFDTEIADDLPMVFVDDEVVALVTGWFKDTQKELH